MTAAPDTENDRQDDRQDEPRAAGGFGWRHRQDLPASAGGRQRWRNPLANRQRAGEVAGDETGRQAAGPAGEQDDDADDDAGDNSTGGLPAVRAIASPAVRDGAGAVLVVKEWADGLSPWNVPLGSARDLLVFARTAPVNFGHIPFVRTANIVFVTLIAAPASRIYSAVQWAFFTSLHRFLTFSVLTLGIGPFANRLLDALVWDGVDFTTWPATIWQWVAGGVTAFVVITVLANRARR